MKEKFDLTELKGRVNDALSLVKSKIEGFVSEDEAFWMAVAMFLLGVIVGIFISPKKKLTTDSNNVITNNYGADAEYCDEDEDDVKF